MTFQRAPWAIDGAQIDATLMRRQLQSATRSGSGIIEQGDLQVLELSVPGPQVRVIPGAFVAVGREFFQQGSYYGLNISDELVDIAATDASGPRSDLIVARVEDPTFGGSPWTGDPAVDQLVFARVIPGVSSVETDMPAGQTGIPLARVDIPPSTATITQDMIVDLRQMMGPLTEPVQRSAQPLAGTSDTLTNADTTFRIWPAESVFNIDIPPWATQVDIEYIVFGAQQFNGDFQFQFFARLGPNISTKIVRYDGQGGAAFDSLRHTIGVSDVASVPAADRGQTRELHLEARTAAPGEPGTLDSDGATSITAHLLFRQLPVTG